MSFSKNDKILDAEDDFTDEPGGGDISSTDEHYAYPNDLPLHPDDDFHDGLVKRIMARARESLEAVQPKFKIWRQLDDELEAYMPKDKEELIAENKDVRTPTAIVVPALYSIIDTLLTHVTAETLTAPIFSYAPRSREDTLGVLLLQSVVQQQAQRCKMALNIHTAWRDALLRGYGPVAVSWEYQEGRVHERVETPVIDPSTGLKVAQEQVEFEDTTVLYEGSVLHNISPFVYLPDPNLPIHEVQKGEFVGYVEITNRMTVLLRERPDADNDEGTWFNARYLKLLSSNLSSIIADESPTIRGHNLARNKYSHPVHIIHMYITLAPKDWGLGESTVPEKWVFSLAGDRILLRAQPLALDHNMYPIAVYAPDFDGYSLAPTSRMEAIYNLQKAANWLWNSRQRDLIKNMHGRCVVNPSKIYLSDLLDYKKSFIRTKQPFWEQSISDAIMPLEVNDLTKGNLQDIGFLTSMMQQVTGAHAGMQGVQRQGSERVTAQEAGTVLGAGFSRIARTVTIGEIQGGQDLAFILASNTKQLMTKKTYVQIVGQLGEDAEAELGLMPDAGPFNEGARREVTPEQLNVHFDVIPTQGNNAAAENLDALFQLIQTIYAVPGMEQEIDGLRMLMWAFRQKGLKNIPDFRRKTPLPAPAQTLAPQPVQQNTPPAQQNALL